MTVCWVVGETALHVFLGSCCAWWGKGPGLEFPSDETAFRFRETMSNGNTITAPHRLNSTLRVRRHRERRREGIRCLTVEMYEADIAEATARGLLKSEGDAWNVLDAWYACHLSDAALQWLAREGDMTNRQTTHIAAALANGVECLNCNDFQR